MIAKVNKQSEIPVFKQIIDFIPPHLLRYCVKTYQSDKFCSKYKTYDQLCATMFGQLNNCYSLRDISLGINQSPEFLSQVGLSQNPVKSTMSDGNEKRSYKVLVLLYSKLLSHY